MTRTAQTISDQFLAGRIMLACSLLIVHQSPWDGWGDTENFCGGVSVMFGLGSQELLVIPSRDGRRLPRVPSRPNWMRMITGNTTSAATKLVTLPQVSKSPRLQIPR